MNPIYVELEHAAEVGVAYRNVLQDRFNMNRMVSDSDEFKT